MGVLTRLALVSMVFATLSVFGKVAQKVPGKVVQDKGAANVGSSYDISGEMTYAEDGGRLNNVSQSKKATNYEAEFSNNNTSGPIAYENNPASVSSTNSSGSKPVLAPIVIPKVKSINTSAKLENATETEVESGGISNASEVVSGKNNNAHESEIGEKSNITEQGPYSVLEDKTGLVDVGASGVQTTSYDTQSSALTTEYNSALGKKTKEADIAYNKEAASSNARSNEQIIGSEVESYERSNGSSVGSLNQYNSSVTKPSEQVNTTGSEKDRSNGSVATSREQFTVPVIGSNDRSSGSGEVSKNLSSSSNVASKSKPTSLDTKSYNKKTQVGAAIADKPAISSIKTSSFPGPGLRSKPSIPVSKYSQDINSLTSGRESTEANAGANVESNRKPMGKTSNSNFNSSKNKSSNTVNGGSETRIEQADVENTNTTQAEGNSDVPEGITGPDAGEQPESPEGIQLGPCARYPFRIEGHKVIFDVELNCQLSVDIDVAKQMNRYGNKSQGKANTNLFEMQTSSGTKAVDGTCPKLQTFILSRGILHIKTSPNCHIIIYTDRITTGTNEHAATKGVLNEATG